MGIWLRKSLCRFYLLVLCIDLLFRGQPEPIHFFIISADKGCALIFDYKPGSGTKEGGEGLLSNKRDPLVDRLLKTPDGKLIRVPNPRNPKLYTVQFVKSELIETIIPLNPNNVIARPQPLNACYLGGGISSGGGGSKSKSRKKDPKGNKKYQDPWMEV